MKTSDRFGGSRDAVRDAVDGHDESRLLKSSREREREKRAHRATSREEMAATFSGCITRPSERERQRAVSSHLA